MRKRENGWLDCIYQHLLLVVAQIVLNLLVKTSCRIPENLGRIEVKHHLKGDGLVIATKWLLNWEDTAFSAFLDKPYLATGNSRSFSVKCKFKPNCTHAGLGKACGARAVGPPLVSRMPRPCSGAYSVCSAAALLIEPRAAGFRNEPTADSNA